MTDSLAPADPRALIDIPVRPEADAFPMLDGEAFVDLATDIREHGQLEPIELDTEGAIGDGRSVMLDRPLAERVVAALRSTLTPSGHLAQRVTHEHLGYCSWRTESERCANMRALIADVEAVLEQQP
jgi:hypothetical protein